MTKPVVKISKMRDYFIHTYIWMDVSKTNINYYTTHIK